MVSSLTSLGLGGKPPLIRQALADGGDGLLARLGDVSAQDPLLGGDGADLVAADGGDAGGVDAGIGVGGHGAVAQMLELKIGAARHGLGGGASLLLLAVYPAGIPGPPSLVVDEQGCADGAVAGRHGAGAPSARSNSTNWGVAGTADKLW